MITDEAAVSLLNEAKSRNLFDKPNPESPDDRIKLAQTFFEKAKSHHDKGSKHEDVKAIYKLGESLGFVEEKLGKDDQRYKDLVMEEIEGLPNPMKPEGAEQIMPYNLEQLTVEQIMKYTGVYNSYFGYANHKYSLEEAGEAAARIIADEAYDRWLVTADHKIEGTAKVKTVKQLEAEAFIEDEMVRKWRTKQKEHAVRAGRYKRLKDTYFENCERLSRAFSAIQDERKYTNG